MSRFRFVLDTDWFWWLTSLFLGIVVGLAGNPLAIGGLLFLAAGMIGCLRPERPWRWALACAPAAHLMTALDHGEFGLFDLVWGMLVTLPAKITIWAPPLLGAYLGSTVRRGPAEQKAPAEPVEGWEGLLTNRFRFVESDGFWWLTSLVLGMAAGLTGHALAIAGILFLAAGVAGYLRPEKPWRWALACVLAAFLVRTLSDSRLGDQLVLMLIFLPASFTLWAPPLLGAYLGSRIRRGPAEKRPEEPAEKQPDASGHWPLWPLVWGLVLGGVVFVVGFFGGLLMFRGSNLAPIGGFLFAPAGLVFGLIAGAVVSHLRRWTNGQMALLLAATAGLCALVFLGYMWSQRSQDDSEILAARINDAARELSRSEQSEESLSFQPPERAGHYSILIAGAETPVRIRGKHLGGLSVNYPQTPEGGPDWGHGRSWGLNKHVVEVPLTLQIAKSAGERTEIVLRKHRGGKVELVELR